MNTDTPITCEACGTSIEANRSDKILAVCGTCGNLLIMATGQLLPSNAVLLKGGIHIRIPTRGGKQTIVPVEHIQIFMELGLHKKI